MFLSEGIQKFLDPAARGAGRFEKIGLPSPELLGPFVGTFEILCGALVRPASHRAMWVTRSASDQPFAEQTALLESERLTVANPTRPLPRPTSPKGR